MNARTKLDLHLRPGQVYRRKDLARLTKAVDRHLRELVDEERLTKVSRGVYMVPRKTRFGKAPASDEKLVETFLGDDRFLMVPPNAFNGLGVGTTQLYNEAVVYNHKRHGRFKLGSRTFDFRMRPSVPRKLTTEVLLVDLLHNADRLAENQAEIVPRALARAEKMDVARLSRAVRDYGSARVQRLLEPVLSASS